MDRAPFLVIWETTQAYCAYLCRRKGGIGDCRWSHELYFV